MKRKLISSIALLILILISLYTAIPYFPAILFILSKHNSGKIDYPISPVIAEELNVESTFTVDIPEENRLIIPSIGIDSEILEGNDLKVLETREGVWRFPDGKNPTQLGNMTIAGHRFQYLPPNTATFYNLDKLKVNDRVLVIWNRHYFVYRIYKVFDVEPTEVQIENDNPDYEREITLYTCTPLGTVNKRLVVKAELIFEE